MDASVLDDLLTTTWIAWATERLRERWPDFDSPRLQRAARAMWADSRTRRLGPIRAATRLLPAHAGV